MPAKAPERRVPGPSAEDRRRRRVTAATASPIAFGQLYVKPFEDNWTGDLPPLTRELLVWLARVRRGVVIMPPEFLKTTALHTYALWVTYRAAQRGRLASLTGMFTSEEAKHSERNLQVVSWHIENNDRLANDYVDVGGRPLVLPDPDEDKWTDSEIIVRRPGKIKDPTWQAKGVGSKGVQGARLGYVLGDDVITPRSADSPAEQKKALRLWDKQISTRLRRHGQAILFGNFNHPRDLVSTLEARPSYAAFRRPALHVKGDPSRPPDSPTDKTAVEQLPEIWPRPRLDQVRKDSPGTFRAVYLLDDRDEKGQRLKPSWVTRIGEDETRLGAAAFFIATDGAPGGEGTDPDYFNVSVLALTDEHADLVACHDLRAEAAEQVDLLASYVRRFARLGRGVRAIGIPKVALDHYFRGAVLIAHPELRGLLQPVSVPGSKDQRLEALGPYAKSGWLRVWEPVWTARTSAPEDQGQELSLEEQWSGFNAITHDDKLDGVDVAIRVAREFGYKKTRKRARLKPN